MVLGGSAQNVNKNTHRTKSSFLYLIEQNVWRHKVPPNLQPRTRVGSGEEGERRTPQQAVWVEPNASEPAAAHGSWKFPLLLNAEPPALVCSPPQLCTTQSAKVRGCSLPLVQTSPMFVCLSPPCIYLLPSSDVHDVRKQLLNSWLFTETGFEQKLVQTATICSFFYKYFLDAILKRAFSLCLVWV